MQFVDGWRYALVLKDEVLARVLTRLPKVVLNVPYFAQFEKKWQDSGAENENEYEFWKWNVCGMACLKMILKYWTGQNYKIIDLAKKCSEYGGYFPQDGETKDGHMIIPGLFYKAFAKFVKMEFDIKTLPTNLLTITRMKWELSRGNMVVASVNKKKHLVVLTGYDEVGKTLTINDPGDKVGKRTLSENEFGNIYNGRGYVFFARKTTTSN